MKRTPPGTPSQLLPIFPAEQAQRFPGHGRNIGLLLLRLEGPFYPLKLASPAWLGYYATRFDAVEINLTFYRSVSPATLARWQAAVPPHFAFALKASQAITHRKRLVACEEDLDRMVEEFSPLGPQLSCILFQLPPSLTVDEDRLEAFLVAVRAQTGWCEDPAPSRHGISPFFLEYPARAGPAGRTRLGNGNSRYGAIRRLAFS